LLIANALQRASEQLRHFATLSAAPGHAATRIVNFLPSRKCLHKEAAQRYAGALLGA
jgi:hypothetical protein